METGKAARIGLVLQPGGVEDAFNSGAYRGFTRAVEQLGVAGRALTVAPREGYLPAFSYLARHGYGLVIGLGHLEMAPIELAARRFPGTMFAIVDGSPGELGSAPRNLHAVTFREQEAGFLAGYLAGLVARAAGAEVVSAVGGEPISSVVRYIAGYESGVRHASPDLSAIHGFTGDFRDPAKARSVARSQIAQGSHVVFQVAGACGLGALEAAREAGVWGVGVDADQSGLGPFVLTSAVKRLDVAAFRTVAAFIAGEIDAGEASVFYLRNGGMELGDISPAVTAEQRAAVAEARAKVLAGEIDVPARLSTGDRVEPTPRARRP